MANDIASVKSEALAYREADFDILEWRVDHYADLSNVESVMAAAKILRETMPEKPLLFTFRSAKEGGEQAISTEAYIALNRAAIDSGLEMCIRDRYRQCLAVSASPYPAYLMQRC